MCGTVYSCYTYTTTYTLLHCIATDFLTNYRVTYYWAQSFLFSPPFFGGDF